ncbi:alpha/beta fold hydrolase [Sulfurovum riftiae]|uniref:2-hydroxy-6-oxohepta-2,4-dienoate hydrolase n=1 Tax=Sulfurovum riftiae TaxID=1630136 RepID=A0A151CG81_9BACT|nr:alpha/beta hydrolase [Sulfurovum riftiae]KYJ86552.1 2-hydroxy-6-oxohepta-2,4-dienoate hydrolase [Sulfurovum riftiae]
MASKEITYKEHSFQLSYEMVNPGQDDVLLVLHGWGSNKEIMKQAFGRLLPAYKHIYLDMPGFGKSSNEMVLTTEDYVAIVRLFLDSLNVRPKIAMGHSFGGKVSTLLDPPCLVLLSSSGILVPKPLDVKVKIAVTKLLKPFKFAWVRKLFASKDVEGMSHAMYETFKNVVNEEFEHNFSAVSGKALLFWGREDTATPLWTAEKIEKMIGDATLYPLDGDHFFFLNHAPFIAQTITDQCKDTDS